MKLIEELESFKDLWRGGFCNNTNGELKDLKGIYRTCIAPYVHNNTVILEIGPGRGFWTRQMIMAQKVICLDALSAEHNRFWQYVRSSGNIKYYQVKDFSCKELNDDSIDYVFSYDVFCHISYSGAKEYLKNLHSKLKDGANGFIMIADADKYYDPRGRKKLMEWAGFKDFDDFVSDYDGAPNNGRWYFYGTQRFCNILEDYGYTVINEDVAKDMDKLSPIIHFKK